jgi:hypothetical protein
MSALPSLASNTARTPSSEAKTSAAPKRNPETPSPEPHCGFKYGNVCPPISPVPIAHMNTEGSAPPTGTSATPAFLRGTFTLEHAGDTFLDFSHLGKGVIWINGHNLGRYWSVGPQQTLYVPGVWLNRGVNHIVVFDMLPTARDSVQGLDHPILNAPVRDQTMQGQQ